MDMILVKILAVFLALSQVVTRPEAIKTQFDRAGDQAEVVNLMRAGCAHMRKAFDVESIDLDGLIATALDDPQALTADIKAFKGLNFASLLSVYKAFCKNEAVDPAVVDVGQVIDYFDQAVANLPDPGRLKGLRLSGTSAVLDAKGSRFAEVSEQDQRRLWVPLAEIPVHVQQAFIAAEDKRFYQHKGIDERGLIRAMVANLARSGRPQGGSTITQQVVKNLLVGDDLTYERKIREMILASRLEQTLSKQEILELYLNSIYLGRGSWGIELAARSYFGKSAADLAIAEGAELAGLTKGPNYFSPDRHPERAQERLGYVLSRMQEDGVINAEQAAQARAAPVTLVAYERQQRDTGFYFLDYINREAKALPGVAALTTATSTVHSTIEPDLQRAAESALQEGLARYELSSGRVQFHGAEANLAEAVGRLKADPGAKDKVAWQQALQSARLPLYDVHWTPAVVVPADRKTDALRVGLADGRLLPLNGVTASVRRNLKPFDVVYVRLTEARGKNGARADLRVRPTVQGAALVLDNKSGRILAMVGGFSYPVSQLNRVSQAQRQPGSSFKPLTYLAALHKGLQPNTLVRDEPITLPPPGRGGVSIIREKDYWTPKNYDSSAAGIITLRRALENSKNLVTANLLNGGIEYEPSESLARVCELALEAQVYRDCIAYYPFVLGAQPARLIDLAAFYAAIANEGQRPSPHAIETIEQNGKEVYRYAPELRPLAGGDRVAFYQLKTMLQGVVARGTARSMAALSPYVAGKTGTSDDENDAWFIGFTNDVTIAIWVGYDNADGKRRTLGGGETGGKVAVPIFQQMVDAVWTSYAKKAPLSPPSPEAQRQLIALPIDLHSGDRITDHNPNAFTEWFRLDPSGQFTETQYQLVSREEAATLAYREPGDGELYVQSPDGYGAQPYSQGRYPQYPSGQPQGGYQPYPQGTYGQAPRGPGGLFWSLGRAFESRLRGYDDREWYPPRRVDPDIPWRDRQRTW